jgi:hypothetical protein
VQTRPRERAGFISNGGEGNYGARRNGRGALGSTVGGTAGGLSGSTGEHEHEWECVLKQLGARGANDGFGLGRVAVQQAAGARKPRRHVATRVRRTGEDHVWFEDRWRTLSGVMSD